MHLLANSHLICNTVDWATYFYLQNVPRSQQLGYIVGLNVRY